MKTYTKCVTIYAKHGMYFSLILTLAGHIQTAFACGQKFFLESGDEVHEKYQQQYQQQYQQAMQQRTLLFKKIIMSTEESKLKSELLSLFKQLEESNHSTR